MSSYIKKHNSLHSKILDILFSIALSLVVILCSVKLTLSFKQIYYFDINYLNIPAITNMAEKDIKSNYDYLIEYNLSSEEKDFKLPTLPSSKYGKIHFEEVRDIFQTLDKLLYVCIGISILGVLIDFRNKNFKFLKYTYISLIAIPILLGLPFIINFDASFILFHKLAFSNNYWIFDPSLDPVINILPQEFFFHEAMLILTIIFGTSFIFRYIYKKLINKS
jgi:integral membrane protein (TIGR01906 family)